MKRCLTRPNFTHARFRAAVPGMFIAMTFLTAILSSGDAFAGECTNINALGVSRVIEIDTAKGPKYGLEQYKEHDFLKKKEIVLTFDDGPTNIYTIPILKALAEQCTKATFFMVGQMARAYPSVVRKVAAAGHTVGTHTWSHKNLGRQSKAQGIKEIELAVSVISKILGRPTDPFFRFPYLSDPKRMIKHLQSRNIGIFSIGVDSKDYLTRSGSRVTNKIMRDLKRQGKGIILFHDIQKSTARALPGLLKKLKAAGYKIVHIKAKDKGVTEDEFDRIAAVMFRKKTVGAQANSSAKTTSSRKANTGKKTASRSTTGSTPHKTRKIHKKRKKYSKASKVPDVNTWTKQIFQGG